jgi:hypothetical protein
MEIPSNWELLAAQFDCFVADIGASRVGEGVVCDLIRKRGNIQAQT